MSPARSQADNPVRQRDMDLTGWLKVFSTALATQHKEVKPCGETTKRLHTGMDGGIAIVGFGHRAGNRLRRH
ncbi:MAG: hypothetical protein ACKV0T_17050 [Planctomycetales bacterium]